MEPENSPFPCGWWATDLEIAGLGSVRPHLSTYACYDYNKLPPVLSPMEGDLGWLEGSRSHILNIGYERQRDNENALHELSQSCQSQKIQLPNPFLKFMSAFAFQERVRSNTDSYLFLCPAPIATPKGEGFLVRFLSDSQGVLFWYIFIAVDGIDHAVVCSPDFYGLESEQWRDEKPDPEKITYCAPSFEVFLWRYWIENEIWLSAYDKEPLQDLGVKYIEEYRQNNPR